MAKLRRFRQDTGLSPKAFSRILRCQSALGAMHDSGYSSSDLAFDLGFSDRSHFLREFKRFVSTTPCDFQRRIAHNAWSRRLRYH